ncbi:MAG: aromatic ring-hydroxylating dioxygenase subunit alpha [Actinomycetes bacterium]
MAKQTSMSAEQLEPSMTGSGQMLPAAAYLDPEVLTWEHDNVFAGGWVSIGRAGSFVKTGDRRAYQVGGEGILVVLGTDGRLRGFYNSCRHRGHELLPAGGEATGSLIRCPYHAWVFTPDGDLRGVPPTHEGDVTDLSQHSLVPVALEVWNGHVMVNMSGDAPPLAQYFEGLDEILAPYGIDDLVVAETHSYTIEANWKLIVENYHECFHCPTVHPELSLVSDTEAGVSVFGDGLFFGGTNDFRDGVETMSLDGSSGGVPIAGLPEKYCRATLYLQVGASLLISLHPDYVMIHRLIALAPDRTFVECQWLFPAAAVKKAGFDPAYAVDFWEITNRQDWTACESVQRGVASRGYRPGPLSSYHEVGVRLFTKWLAQAYSTGVVTSRARELLSDEQLASLAFPVES